MPSFITLDGTPPPRHARDIVHLDKAHQALLMVVIDTEEERPWNGTYPRTATSVTAMREIERAQAIFDQYGICPTYVIDYPVASQCDGYGPLREICASNRCVIGAHLHPWVNPPFTEKLNRPNTFAGNLDPEVELAKLRALVETIQSNLGVSPRVYKAGRYGIGPNTPGTLLRLGFEVDTSVSPAFEYLREGGPNFTKYSNHPFWLERSGRLLEVPTTGSFVGLLHRWDQLYQAASAPWPRRLHVQAVLSRLRFIDRLRLSPEYYRPLENRRLTLDLLKRGVRTFTFSFHSPSLKPGCTPYVRDNRELQKFLDNIRRYLDFFLGDLGGQKTTPLQVRQYLIEKESTAKQVAAKH